MGSAEEGTALIDPVVQRIF